MMMMREDVPQEVVVVAVVAGRKERVQLHHVLKRHEEACGNTWEAAPESRETQRKIGGKKG